jgi:hypothetical protein
MNTVEFFERVLPKSEQIFYYGLALGGAYPLRARCAGPEELYCNGLSWSGGGRNAYFAPAGFNGPAKTQDSAVMARAVWLDIDCEKKRALYPTFDEGLTALFQFVYDLKLPEPLIVGSGQGLQAYWPFAQNVLKSDWHYLAKLLKKAVAKHGLKIDPQFKMENIASVLRIPETVNYGKDGIARPVYVLQEGETTDPAQFGAALIRYAGDAEGAESCPLPGSASAGPGAHPLLQSQTDWDPVPIVAGCAQLRMAADNLASRQSWLYMLAVMRFCKNGREAAHYISQTDSERYDPAELDRQFNSVGTGGPILCATFKKEDPVPCEGCPWAGAVSTPIEIAKRAGTRRAVAAPPPAALPAASAAPALVPYNGEDYRVVPGQGLYRINRPRADPDQPPPEPRLELINHNEFYITEVQSDTENVKQEKRYIKFTVKSPGRNYKTVYYNVEEYAKNALPTWLAQHGLMPIKPEYDNYMWAFMGSYISSLQNQVAKEQKSHFGWTVYTDPLTSERMDGFVAGQDMFTAKGPVGVGLSAKCQTMEEREFQRSGDLETWKAIPEMYRTLDQKEAQLFMCGAFAAPFMAFGSATAKNLILSMWDARGGKGKSTLLQIVNSVWGHPTLMNCSKNDTMSARFQVLSARKNLPFCMDELTTMQEQELSGLLFDIANGRERRKSHRSGADLVNTGGWETITFISSNRSVYELMKGQSAQTTAESMRVIEIPCTFRNYAGTELGSYIEDCLYLLNTNYGWAGPAFMADCFRNPQIFDEISDQAGQWDRKHKVSADERFWTYGLGTILAAGRLAVRYGYLNYDMDALERWALTTLLPKIRSKVNDSVETPVGLLSEFVNSSLGNMLVVAAAKRTSSQPADCADALRDMYVKRYPSRELQLRLEVDTQSLYVSLQALTDWCIRRRVSWEVLQDYLLREKIWLGTVRTCNLAKNVDILGRTSVRCLKFSLLNVDMPALPGRENEKQCY